MSRAALRSCIGSLDQGTSSTRFILFDEFGRSLASHQISFQNNVPQNGWVEVDPHLLLSTSLLCIEKTMAQEDVQLNYKVKSIGITNQRETCMFWDRFTGEALAPAIIWMDTRTKETCEELRKIISDEVVKNITGLPISTYFSAVKAVWMIKNIKKIKDAIQEKRALFGTVDTWLLWNLSGGVHATDVTNSSRTLLLNLKTGQWDLELCKLFQIPLEILPEVRSSSEVYGHIKSGSLKGVPIASLIGDQQGALVGQLCFDIGDVKNTYGTGCFMLLNTGPKIVRSSAGLLTTIGFQLGKDEPIQYALEGSVAIAGAAISWLKNQMELISKPEDMRIFNFVSWLHTETLAKKVPDSGGVYFVPAFSGLFAPYWREDARG